MRNLHASPARLKSEDKKVLEGLGVTFCARLTYTGFLEELEYLKIETRLIDEKFASVMGECVI
jgi:hypothetical protein